MHTRLVSAALLGSCLVSSFAYAADDMRGCIAKASAIHVGMTRAEVESRMQHDGGLAGIYRNERLFFTAPKPGQKLCKLTIDFKPYGISESVYDDPNKFSRWTRARRAHNPKDVVVKVSAPFLEFESMD